jgi:cell division protein FtsB
MKISPKIRFYSIFILLLAGVLFFIFNSNGLLKYMELKERVTELQIQIDSVDRQNKMLEDQIDSLTRKVPAKIEQTARENYDMLRKGEVKVEVIEK